MYDPTIYDNLKVVLEGAVYDLERSGRIQLVGRQDLLDLASINRSFQIEMGLPEEARGEIAIRLSSGLNDFAAELLQTTAFREELPGCRVTLTYTIQNLLPDAHFLQKAAVLLLETWNDEVELVQTVETEYLLDLQKPNVRNHYRATVTFVEKINEDHIQKLPELVDFATLSLEKLQDLLESVD